MQKLRLPVFLLALVMIFQSSILTAGAYSTERDNGKSVVTFATGEKIWICDDNFERLYKYDGTPVEVSYGGTICFSVEDSGYLIAVEVNIDADETYEFLDQVREYDYRITGIVGDITVAVEGRYGGVIEPDDTDTDNIDCYDTPDTPTVPDYTENFDISFIADEWDDYLTVYHTTDAKYGEAYTRDKRFYARNGETGDIDNSGEGELNLAFVNNYPCKWLRLNILGDYGEIIKTDKFRYRVTNIKSDLLVSFDFERTSIPQTEYNIDFAAVDQNRSIIDINDFADIDVYYTFDAETPDEVNVENGYARDCETGEITVYNKDASFRFGIRPKEPEGMSAHYLSWDIKGYSFTRGQECENSIVGIGDDIIIVFQFDIHEKDPDKYRVTFLENYYCQADVYNSVYSQTPDEANAKYGYARNEKTGEFDVSGNGVCIFKRVELTVYDDQYFLGVKVYGSYDSLDYDDKTDLYTIRGIKGELYVDFEYGYFFGEQYMIGDVNNDWKITSKDSLIIQRYNIGLEKDLSEWQVKAADADGNEKITNADALLILRYTLNLVNKDETKIGDTELIIYRW